MYIFLDGRRGIRYNASRGLYLRHVHQWSFDIMEEEMPGSAGVFRVF